MEFVRWIVRLDCEEYVTEVRLEDGSLGVPGALTVLIGTLNDKRTRGFHFGKTDAGDWEVIGAFTIS